jgi:hypothetical protein
MRLHYWDGRKIKMPIASSHVAQSPLLFSPLCALRCRAMPPASYSSGTLTDALHHIYMIWDAYIILCALPFGVCQSTGVQTIAHVGWIDKTFLMDFEVISLPLPLLHR